MTIRNLRQKSPGHSTRATAPNWPIFRSNCNPSADADIVVAVGGDGTVSEVGQGLTGTGKALGIIPCGSGDGLALHLGIPRDPVKAVQILNTGDISPMDMARVNDRPFFCTTGVGFDAVVAWNFAQAGHRGL